MSEPEKLGNFEIVGKLGRGSFGTVYEGRDPGLGRAVAIKVCTVADADLRRRFAREAEISGRLQHPNIVGVYAFDERDGVPYLVQEYLAGEDLRQVVKRRDPWPLTRRLDTLIQIAEGLAYAHGQGVVHRDIKPANIRILPDERVKIMDFGIAKLANDESQLTQKGVTMGTASYLPPEQVRGGDVDQRADIFSFGVLAYELLTFERPFRGKTISALVYQILYKAPRALSDAWSECPSELSDLIGRCLEKDAEARYATADELLGALRAVRADVEADRWPGLEAPTPPPPLPTAEVDPGSGTSHAFVSESQMHRAVTSVEEIPSADADQAATRRIPASELPTIERPVGSDADQAATRRIPASELPTMARPAEARPAEARPAEARPAEARPAEARPAEARPAEATSPTADDGKAAEHDEDEALATSAHEISQLVSAGNLEAAMEQLEETMATVSRPPPVPEPPTGEASTSIPFDAEAPTRPLPREQLEAVRAMAPPTHAPTEPAVPPPSPSRNEPWTGPAPKPTSSSPPARPTPTSPPPRPPQPAPSRATMTRVAGAIAAVLVLTVLAFVFFRGDDEPRPAPPVEPVETPEPTPPPPPALPERGVLLVESVPWTRIVEIARFAETEPNGDLDGEAQPTAGEDTATIDEATAQSTAEPTDEAGGPRGRGQAPPQRQDGLGGGDDATAEALVVAEVLPLPVDATTPLRLDLPPGRYRVTLAKPDADGAPLGDPDASITCDVTVTIGAEARCARSFGKPSVLDLFKENGWWS